MGDIALTLTTTVAPAKQVKIDGIEYDLLGTDHLSPDEEAEVTALFARHNFLNVELEQTKNVTKGKGISEQIRATRISILAILTSVPKDVLNKLPLTSQVKLLEVIQDSMEDDDEPEEAEGEGGAE